jgi:hypothetical protein
MRPRLPKLDGARSKMPDVRAPDFLADVYYDLRDRRLLPLLALIVVATVAVPFLLGSDSEGPRIPAQASEGAPVVAGPNGASLTVVEATPGLRDYRKRLHGTPTDPFVQKYTGVPAQSRLKSVGGDSDVSGSSGGKSSTGAESPSSTEGDGAPDDSSGSAPSGGSPSGDGDKKGGGKAKGNGKAKSPRLFTFVVDVQISRSEATPDGSRKMSEPKVHKKVRPLTQLPGRKAPVVTTMGLNLHTGKVLFLVSNDVKSLDGEFKCVARAPTKLCELLEVEAGFPFEVVYGPNDVHYRFKVTNVGVAWAGRVGDKRSSKADLEADYGPILPQSFSK